MIYCAAVYYATQGGKIWETVGPTVAASWGVPTFCRNSLVLLIIHDYDIIITD